MRKIISIFFTLVLVCMPTLSEASTKCVFYQEVSNNLVHQLILYINQKEDNILSLKEYRLNKDSGEWNETDMKDKEKVKLSNTLTKLVPLKFEERPLNYKELEVFSKLTNINLNETRISCDGEVFKLKYKNTEVTLYVKEDSTGRLLNEE